jgi:excisionase family DNA binding protein
MSAIATVPPPKWLTLGVAARQLGVSVNTVRRLAREGRLTVRTVPGSWPKVLADEIDALAAASTRPARVA